MSCPKFDILSAYIDAETGGVQTRSVEAHVDECAACRRKLASMRAAKTALRELPVPALPADLAAELAALGGGVPRRGMLEVLRTALSMRNTVAAFALAAGIAFMLWVRQAGLLVPRLDVPADLLMAAHNQYALTMPLAPSEKILSEMPVRLAGGMAEERDVY
ncbi:MAG: zf-HC2 domain-containing protein [Elusimicrobiota bacterium]